MLNDPANASAGYTVFHRRQMGVASFTASSVQARDYGLYVQDTWKPASRLSLTIGLRGEFVRTRDLVFDTDIEHGWNLGPRLGAAWLLTPDARNVLRASYGVLHDMPQAVLIASIGATRVARTDYYDNDSRRGVRERGGRAAEHARATRAGRLTRTCTVPSSARR